MRTSRPVILRPAGTGLVCACTDATAASRSGASSRWRFDRPHRDGRVRDTKSGTVGWVEPTAKPIVFPAGRAMGFASLYPSYGFGVTRAGWYSPTGSTSSDQRALRSEEHTSELQSLMRNSYAVLCLQKKTYITQQQKIQTTPTNTFAYSRI